ncbi:MAG: YdbL family protein [Nitrospira sp.]|nr:YdbL family protein [Nitrospira sp.]
MMVIVRLTIAAYAAILWTAITPFAFALSLDEAKAKGLVGEKTNGYLGAVNSSNAEAQALIEDVNQKRRQAYEDIAKRNRTGVLGVETLAGEKAIQNTKPGNFIEGPGGWMKK